MLNKYRTVLSNQFIAATIIQVVVSVIISLKRPALANKNAWDNFYANIGDENTGL